MATPSVPQKSVSRRHFLSAVATIPAAAALAPVLSKVEAAAPNVEAWHVHPEIQRLVLDARGDVVAWADAPELARAIAEGGGYTLAKPAGAPAPRRPRCFHNGRDIPACAHRGRRGRRPPQRSP